ncbi:hypothetical protein AX774_g1451 [Zancudomyces culisetae]|uniref:Pentatricopeptide repeat-containing protein-mitochondrial domain-containing protein n=1 Tax=Zancudomyces culisetae TaxID=1213189 RepID=A0A1R1PVM3_ZANCU|nr:hypothetical protein AX774_g1451 [Zancudomyces culisetae]|eukprot:OMH85003.1 hypothetical protein AX774_g1451 [Zancudomyces culisetae]
MDQTNEARQKMLQSNNKDVYRDKATNGSRPDERATDEISRVMDAQQEQQMYEYLIKTMLSMDHSELGYIYFNSRKGKGVSIELVDMLISKMCVDNEIELACKTYVDLLNQKIKLNYSNDINSGGGIASNIDPENSAVLLPATSLRLLREISRTLDLPDINIDGGNENSSNTIAGNNTGTASKSNGTSMIELLWKKCTQVHKLQLTESDCLGVLNVASRYGKTGLASDVLQTLLGILKQKKIALSSSVPPTSNLSSLMALAMTNTTSSMELLQEYHLEPLFEAFLTARNYRRAFETLHLMRANKMGHGTDTCITITRHLLSTYKDSVKHNMVIEKILGELYNCKYSPKRTNAIDESDPSQKDLDSRLSNKNNNNNSNPSYGKFPKAVTARTVDAILKYYFHTKQLNLGISKTEFYYQKFELEKNYLTILMMLEGCFISNNYYTAKLIYNSSPILPPVLSKHTGSQFAQNKAKGRNSFLSPGDVGSLAPNSSMDAREYLPRIYKLMILISLNSQNYEDSFIYLEAIKNTGTIPSYEIYSKIALKCEYYKDPRLEAIIEEMRLYGYNTNNAF